jgi:hypothetical protein
LPRIKLLVFHHVYNFCHESLHFSLLKHLYGLVVTEVLECAPPNKISVVIVICCHTYKCRNRATPCRIELLQGEKSIAWRRPWIKQWNILLPCMAHCQYEILCQGYHVTKLGNHCTSAWQKDRLINSMNNTIYIFLNSTYVIKGELRKVVSIEVLRLFILLPPSQNIRHAFLARSLMHDFDHEYILNYMKWGYINDIVAFVLQISFISYIIIQTLWTSYKYKL